MSELNFEKSIERLKEICALLKDDTLSLEDTLKLYKEGKEISVKCSELLNDFKSELNVQMINDIESKNDENDEIPF